MSNTKAIDNLYRLSDALGLVELPDNVKIVVQLTSDESKEVHDYFMTADDSLLNKIRIGIRVFEIELI